MKPFIMFAHLPADERATIATWVYSLPPDTQKEVMKILMEADKLAEAYAIKVAQLEAFGLKLNH